MDQIQFTTFRDAEEFAARQGVTLTAKDRARIADLQNAERRHLWNSIQTPWGNL